MNSTSDLDKTVFISYRREPSRYLALAMFKELQRRGYDVFWDVESIGAGQFEPIILTEIGRRAHFVLLLANKTLDRCSETGDWLKREVEYAMSLGSKVIPLMVDGFDLKDNVEYLTGELSKLTSYNGMPFLYQYFDAGIDKLCNQFLTNKNYGEILEAIPEKERVEQIIEEATNEPIPSEAQMEAERLLNQGFNKLNLGDLDGAIFDWDEAIRLNPNFDVAYSNRGGAKSQKGDYAGSLYDLDKAISINPNNATFFSNRGATKFLSKDIDGSLDDYKIAIELDPNYSSGYQNRANTYRAKSEFQNALIDQNKVIELYPSDSRSYSIRADIYQALGNLDLALVDLNFGIQLDPTNAYALNSRGVIYQNKGKLQEALADYNNALNMRTDIEDTNFIAMLYSNRGEVNFLLRKISHALRDFETARKYLPKLKTAIVGMIVAYHAQGQVKKARRMWQDLIKLDSRYGDMDWLQTELNWADALVDEARKLVSTMDNKG